MIVGQELGFVLVPVGFLIVQNTAALYTIAHNTVQRMQVLAGGDYLTARRLIVIKPVAQNIDFLHLYSSNRSDLSFSFGHFSVR